MEIKPLSERHQTMLALPLLVVLSPVWAPALALAVVLVVTFNFLKATFDPPRWHKVFALWPVECDQWPEDGFGGWVWWESVWRNPASTGWSKYRREAPADHQGDT